MNLPVRKSLNYCGKLDQNKNHGFTLVELLIVISLIAIMTGALIPSFAQYIENQNLRQAQEQLKSDLKAIQARALTGEGSDGSSQYWGIRIVASDTKQYYFFKSINNNGGACSGVNINTSERSTRLPGDIVVKNPSSGSWCVFFKFSDGDANMVKDGTSGCNNNPTSCPINLGSPASTTNCGGVRINRVGLVTKTALNQSCT